MTLDNPIEKRAYQFNQVKGQPFIVSELVDSFEQLIKS